jgi:hypothetical protein
MSRLDRNQERLVIEALVALPEMKTMDSFRAESVRAIEALLQCSGEEAQGILNDLRERNRIEAALTPRGDVLNTREPMPKGRLRWVWPTDE